MRRSPWITPDQGSLPRHKSPSGSNSPLRETAKNRIGARETRWPRSVISYPVAVSRVDHLDWKGSIMPITRAFRGAAIVFAAATAPQLIRPASEPWLPRRWRVALLVPAAGAAAVAL